MEVTIKVTNTHWSFNGKPYNQCKANERYLIGAAIRISVLESPVKPKPQPTFKARAAEIKNKYNYKFNL
jgi:hypothetical protein